MKNLYIRRDRQTQSSICKAIEIPGIAIPPSPSQRSIELIIDERDELIPSMNCQPATEATDEEKLSGIQESLYCKNLHSHFNVFPK